MTAKLTMRYYEAKLFTGITKFQPAPSCLETKVFHTLARTASLLFIRYTMNIPHHATHLHIDMDDSNTCDQHTPHVVHTEAHAVL
ncbi:hypothetical protein E2C01_046346 [Portunus trituberculatus]|uniref:Uncharacterized protein n=1 Tax=Portunus trituberculatus TaxID=210409 RepID=A0A5B7G4I7_PORTR|nr:hypothetical protein [Portunus trituberculatus]